MYFSYVSDIEMRMGFLGRLSDLPLNGHMMQPQGLADIVRSNNQIGKLLFRIFINIQFLYSMLKIVVNYFIIPIIG